MIKCSSPSLDPSRLLNIHKAVNPQQIRPFHIYSLEEADTTILSRQHTNALLHPTQQSQQPKLDSPSRRAVKAPQSAPDVSAYIIEPHDTGEENNDSHRLLDPVLDEALGRVLDVPIAPFGEHAADGVVNLRVAFVSRKKKG